MPVAAELAAIPQPPRGLQVANEPFWLIQQQDEEALKRQRRSATAAVKSLFGRNGQRAADYSPAHEKPKEMQTPVSDGSAAAPVVFQGMSRGEVEAILRERLSVQPRTLQVQDSIFSRVVNAQNGRLRHAIVDETLRVGDLELRHSGLREKDASSDALTLENGSIIVHAPVVQHIPTVLQANAESSFSQGTLLYFSATFNTDPSAMTTSGTELVGYTGTAPAGMRRPKFHAEAGEAPFSGFQVDLRDYDLLQHPIAEYAWKLRSVSITENDIPVQANVLMALRTDQHERMLADVSINTTPYNDHAVAVCSPVFDAAHTKGSHAVLDVWTTSPLSPDAAISVVLEVVPLH